MGAVALPFLEVVGTQGPFATVRVGNYANYALITSLETLVQIFFQAYIAICTTLLYFDLRNRKETFDLELEADKLSAWTEHFRPQKYPTSQDIQQADPGIQPPGAAESPDTNIRPSSTDMPPSGL
jgi:hypothetical protein